MGLFDKWLAKGEVRHTLPSDIPPVPDNGFSAASGAAVSADRQAFAGLEGIRFGRYNDNNKSYAQTKRWQEAEALFKEKKYNESFAAFFDYIADKDEKTVIFRQDGDQFSLELIQGSKKIYAHSDGSRFVATVSLALMETPGIAVMRRLLDLNYVLYYSRCALNEQGELCMLLDFTIPMASPAKLYYGLRELATRADQLDDQLLADFGQLKPTATAHLLPLPAGELEVKYRFFRKWITDTLNQMQDLNQDAFAGAIAYLMLTMLYRIEFLLVPESGLLIELEQVSSLYWNKKDETALVERNKMMKDAVEKLLDIPEATFAKSMYRTAATFAVASPPPPDKIRENILGANRDAAWYMDNKYPGLGLVLNEYGVVYSNYAFSLPLLYKDLGTVYMAVMHADFFIALGMKHPFYDPASNTFNRPAIEQAVMNAVNYFPDKYLNLQWDHSKISYDSLFGFGISFTAQLANLNPELKK